MLNNSKTKWKWVKCDLFLKIVGGRGGSILRFNCLGVKRGIIGIIFWMEKCNYSPKQNKKHACMNMNGVQTTK